MQALLKLTRTQILPKYLKCSQCYYRINDIIDGVVYYNVFYIKENKPCPTNWEDRLSTFLNLYNDNSYYGIKDCPPNEIPNFPDESTTTNNPF